MSSSIPTLEQLQSAVRAESAALAETLGNGANAAVAAAYLGDALNKSVRLGRALKQAQAAAGATGADPAPARELLTSPIVAEFSAKDLKSFYSNSLNRVLFPALEVFFGPEMEEFDRTKGACAAETLALLDAGRIVLAVLKQDPDLVYQDNLRDLFLLSIGPEDTNIRGMAREFATLFPAPAVSYDEMYERLAGYWKAKLTFEAEKADPGAWQRYANLETSYRQAVTAALDDEAIATAALALAADLKREAATARLAELQAELATTLHKKETEEFIAELTEYLAAISAR